MPYSFDDSKPRKKYEQNNHRQVPPVGMRKYNDWRRQIVEKGLGPKEAAENVGDCHYEEINKSLGLYSIRLTQAHRVLFQVKGNEIIINGIGGHY